MDETEAIGVRVGQSHDFADLVGLVKAFEEEPFIDSTVLETQNLYSNAVRLAKACAEDVAVVISDGDRVACL